MFLALILQNFKQNKFADSRKSFLNCTALGKICLSRLWLKLDLIWPLIDYILFLAFKQTWHNLHWLIDWLIERERERERERMRYMECLILKLHCLQKMNLVRRVYRIFLLFNSVARWVVYLLNFWSFTTIKICLIAKIAKADTKFCKKLITPTKLILNTFKILPKWRNFAKSGHSAKFFKGFVHT